MTVFQAAKKVETHFQATIVANTVQISAVYAISHGGQILKFRTIGQARNVVPTTDDGYIFKCTYRNGSVEVEPSN